MGKVTKVKRERAMVSPYSGVGDETKTKTEWDEARCPICLEPPHNAVLLLCSSHDMGMGCRPFICDTSYRHSNCLDQFRKSAAGVALPQNQSNLVCPLCRGAISGWKVVKPARTFMDSKTRSCSLETCSFSGKYQDLRKHARGEHPCKRPSEASPTRQSNWVEMEQQRAMEDARAYGAYIDYVWSGGGGGAVMEEAHVSEYEAYIDYVWSGQGPRRRGRRY